jgi:hypothetical protein
VVCNFIKCLQKLVRLVGIEPTSWHLVSADTSEAVAAVQIQCLEYPPGNPINTELL